MMKKTTAIIVTACLLGATSSAMAAERSKRVHTHRADPAWSSRAYAPAPYYNPGWSSYDSAAPVPFFLNPGWWAYGSAGYAPYYNPGWSAYGSGAYVPSYNPGWSAYGSGAYGAFNPYEDPTNEEIRLDPAKGDIGG